MDSMHDLGGMHGFGRVEPEQNEPVFHAAWEGRMFALLSAVPFAVQYGDDQFRPAVEKMPPEDYLASNYYEKWYTALMALLNERGALAEHYAADGAAVRASAVIPAIMGGASQARPDAKVAQRLKAGDRVMTRATMGSGHNRLPRYARGKIGVVESVHGAFLVADRNATGDQTPEMLYTVRFEAMELWGPEASAGDALSLDLWDCYLKNPDFID